MSKPSGSKSAASSFRPSGPTGAPPIRGGRHVKALLGVVIGASIGSVAGPLGIAAGAALGATLGYNPNVV